MTSLNKNHAVITAFIHAIFIVLMFFLPDLLQYLTVRSDYRQLRLPFNEILYVEGLKDYVKIYVTAASARSSPR